LDLIRCATKKGISKRDSPQKRGKETFFLFIAILGGFIIIWVNGIFFFPERAFGGTPPPSDSKNELHGPLQLVLKNIAEKKYDPAYQMVLVYWKTHPLDWEALFLKAFLERKLGNPQKSLDTTIFALHSHPLDYDLIRLGAEDLIDLKHYRQARAVLTILTKRNPDDPIVLADLLKLSVPLGFIQSDPFFDQHIAITTGPTVPISFDAVSLTEFDRWSLTSRILGMSYNGGSSLAVDTFLETPLYEDTVRFVVGRTEYLGGAQSLGSGWENFTYAGIDVSKGALFHGLFEAGNTQIRPSPGFYTHMTSNLGRFSLDVQGYDNMIWGDFGQSILLDGIETGGVLSLTTRILPHFWAGVQYWYFQYDLNGGSVPWGILHNSTGYLDVNVLNTPSIDLFAGYDSWDVATVSPSEITLIPMIPQMGYFYGGFNVHKNFHKFTLQAQAEVIDNVTVSPFLAYDAGAGFGYHPFSHIDLLGAFTYFNESTVVYGPMEVYTAIVRVTF